MNPIEHGTLSFVVRIWLEETAEEAGRALWRGRITHVDSGEQDYLRTLGDVTAFIAPFLAGLGVRLCPIRRMMQWLRARPRERPPA